MLVKIWNSFRAMPIWVQIWVGLLLVPANLAAIFFLDQPSGVWIAFARPDGSGAYDTYLWILLAVNLASLGFDYPDAIKWWKGDRAAAGR